MTNDFCDGSFAAGSNTSSMHCGGLGTSYEYFGPTPAVRRALSGKAFLNIGSIS